MKGVGMDFDTLLKLAGYGGKEDDTGDYINYLRLMAEQGLGQRRETRESTTAIAQIEAERLKNQIAFADLQRKLDEMQQTGRKTDVDTLVELSKSMDPATAERARKALAKSVPALREQEEEEVKGARGKRVREITDTLAAAYKTGDPKVLNTAMLTLTGELEQDPELNKAIPWGPLNQRWPVAPTNGGKATQQPVVPPQTAGADNWSYVAGRQKVPTESVSTAAPPTATPREAPVDEGGGLLSRLTSSEGVRIADLLAPKVDARNLPSAWEHQIPQLSQFMPPEAREKALERMPDAAFRALGLETPDETRGRIEGDPRYMSAEQELLQRGTIGGRPIAELLGGSTSAVGQGAAWEHQIPQVSQFRQEEEPSQISAVQPGEYQPSASFPRQQQLLGPTSAGPQWTVQDLLSKFMMDQSEQERLPWTYGPWNPPTGGGLPSPVGGLKIDPRLLGQPKQFVGEQY